MRDLRHERHHSHEPDFNFNAAKIGASILTGVGSLLAITVVSMIYGVLAGEEELAIIGRLAPRMQEMKTLTMTNGETLVLPDAAFYFGAYFMAAIFIGMASKLSLAMITGGLKLLKDEPAKRESDSTKTV